MSNNASVQSVTEFDLTRYCGLWYEVGRLPLKWEDAAARDITAEYSLNDDGSVQVDNRCLDEDGKPTRSVGRATVVEGATAQLAVTFLPAALRWLPFTKGDYWVLKLDPDYQVALVGTPDHKNLWLLSRTPRLEPLVVEEYRAAARAQGFDLTDWITPQQSGQRVTDDQLDD